MSKTSRKSTFLSAKRLALFATSGITAAILLALPRTQEALPLPTNSLRSAKLLLSPAVRLLPGTNDYWHTAGSQILDRAGHPVRIEGVNWSGFETTEAVPGGLDAQDYRVILKIIKKNGFNTVRIPLSNELVELPTVPSRIRFRNSSGPINEDLRDLTSIEILDKIIASCAKIGLKVILDDHRSEAGSSAEENGLWYTAEFPESAWIEDWASLARRYQDQSAVIGMDLRNEPHNAKQGGACWDCGGSRDWHLAAERAGNAILAVNPRLLILVEGVDTYGDDTAWWGGNLAGVRQSPVRLSVPGRLVYSAHEYGPLEYNQGWFNASTSPATLTSMWRRRWAFVSEAGIAPVWIGEFGTTNDAADIQSSLPGSEGQWFSTLVDFLRARPNLGWTYWGINAEDRYGLLGTDYSLDQPKSIKLGALASINRNAGSVSSTERSSEPEVELPPAMHVIYAEPSASFTPVASTQGNGTLSRTTQRTSRTRAPVPGGDGSTHVRDQGMHDAIAASIREAVRTANSSLE